MARKRLDRSALRAEEARERQVAYEAMRPSELLLRLRERGVTSGRQVSRLTKLMNAGKGNVPLEKIRLGRRTP